ncbi:hypothetical protein BC827DRAFT_1274406 [Russula dissimulans]|nr:hypothetical protein BC827DRAFT_1274406 [Russula dissimulans]
MSHSEVGTKEQPTFKVCTLRLGVCASLAHSAMLITGLKVNLKAIRGHLFMLDKFIFFVSKQPMLIEIPNIHQSCLISSADNKEEHELMDTCLKDKKLCVKNEMLPDGDLLLTVAGGDLDEETAEYRW